MRITSAGIPATTVGTVDDLLADLPLVNHPHGGPYRVVPALTGEAAHPDLVRRHAPLHGEHNREVMAELGYGALLLVPVVTQGDAIGLLTLFRDEARPWTLAEIRLARIGAGQLAAALERLSA